MQDVSYQHGVYRCTSFKGSDTKPKIKTLSRPSAATPPPPPPPASASLPMSKMEQQAFGLLKGDMIPFMTVADVIVQTPFDDDSLMTGSPFDCTGSAPPPPPPPLRCLVLDSEGNLVNQDEEAVEISKEPRTCSRASASSHTASAPPSSGPVVGCNSFYAYADLPGSVWSSSNSELDPNEANNDDGEMDDDKIMLSRSSAASSTYLGGEAPPPTKPKRQPKPLETEEIPNESPEAEEQELYDEQEEEEQDQNEEDTPCEDDLNARDENDEEQNEEGEEEEECCDSGEEDYEGPELGSDANAEDVEEVTATGDDRVNAQLLESTLEAIDPEEYDAENDANDETLEGEEAEEEAAEDEEGEKEAKAEAEAEETEENTEDQDEDVAQETEEEQAVMQSDKVDQPPDLCRPGYYVFHDRPANHGTKPMPRRSSWSNDAHDLPRGDRLACQQPELPRCHSNPVIDQPANPPLENGNRYSERLKSLFGQVNIVDIGNRIELDETILAPTIATPNSEQPSKPQSGNPTPVDLSRAPMEASGGHPAGNKVELVAPPPAQPTTATLSAYREGLGGRPSITARNRLRATATATTTASVAATTQAAQNPASDFPNDVETIPSKPKKKNGADDDKPAPLFHFDLVEKIAPPAAVAPPKTAAPLPPPLPFAELPPLPPAAAPGLSSSSTSSASSSSSDRAQKAKPARARTHSGLPPLPESIPPLSSAPLPVPATTAPSNPDFTPPPPVNPFYVDPSSSSSGERRQQLPAQQKPQTRKYCYICHAVATPDSPFSLHPAHLAPCECYVAFHLPCYRYWMSNSALAEACPLSGRCNIRAPPPPSSHPPPLPPSSAFQGPVYTL